MKPHMIPQGGLSVNSRTGVLPYLHVQYAVSEWGVADGLQYPKKSTLDWLAPPRPGDPNTKVLRYVSISVDTVGRWLAPMPVIAITNLTLVADHTLGAGSRPLVYPTSNAFVEKGTEREKRVMASIQAMERVQARHEKESESHKGSNRSYVVMIFIALLLVPPVYICLKSTSNKKRNNANGSIPTRAGQFVANSQSIVANSQFFLIANRCHEV